MGGAYRPTAWTRLKKNMAVLRAEGSGAHNIWTFVLINIFMVTGTLEIVEFETSFVIWIMNRRQKVWKSICAYRVRAYRYTSNVNRTVSGSNFRHSIQISITPSIVADRERFAIILTKFMCHAEKSRLQPHSSTKSSLHPKRYSQEDVACITTFRGTSTYGGRQSYCP